MKKKRGVRKHSNKGNITTTKMMFLSIILLFIIFEALYIVKGQLQLAQTSSVPEVAGVQTSK